MATSYLDLELPDVSTLKDNANIQECTTKINISSGTELDVFYLDASPTDGAVQNSNRKPSVLLLHGMRFTSDTWRQLETVQTLSVLGYRVVAMDLPGYGKTGGSQLRGTEAGGFLESFIKSTKINNIVIVSPSMSGCYALPYIFSTAMRPQISGYVPVAPIETGAYTRQQYSERQFPVMIVYGEKDDVLGAESLSNLTGFPDKHIICFPNAGHPCYLDDPGLWHKALYNFLQKLP